MRISFPRVLLQVEGLSVLILSLLAYAELGESWTKFLLFFLVPDVAMAAYLFGPAVGSKVYNGFHTYVAPFLLWLFVYFVHWPSLTSVCLIWVAHIAFDRTLSFGLKYQTNIRDTHLNRV